MSRLGDHVPLARGAGYRHCGRRAVSQPPHAREALNAQVLAPLAPAAAWIPSASSWRLPPMSHASVIPAGEAIVMLVVFLNPPDSWERWLRLAYRARYCDLAGSAALSQLRALGGR
jgi:hypothetical protein